MRAVLELGGIRDVLAKSLGTTNPINMLKAAEAALRDLRRPEEVALARGKSIRDVLPSSPAVEPEEAAEVGQRSPSLKSSLRRPRGPEDVDSCGDEVADAEA